MIQCFSNCLSGWKRDTKYGTIGAFGLRDAIKPGHFGLTICATFKLKCHAAGFGAGGNKTPPNA